MTRTLSLLLLALAVGACASVGRLVTDSDVPEGPDPVAIMPDTPEGEQGTEVEPTTGPSTAALLDNTTQLCGSIGEEWCVDSDGNRVPDMIEVELGYAPEVDDCAPGACPSSPPIEEVVVAAATPVLVAVDGSLGMDEDFGGVSRAQAARDAVIRLSTGLPDFVRAGLVTFGDGGGTSGTVRAESCTTVPIHVFPSDMTAETVDTDVGNISAIGARPLANLIDTAGAALDAARAEDDPDGTAPRGRMVILTSGADDCQGDPMEAVDHLGDNPPVIDVVAMAVPDQATGQLRAIADATGGRFTSVAEPQGLAQTMDAVASQPADVVRGVLCDVERSVRTQNCERTFVDNADDHLQQMADGMRTDGAGERADLVEAFADALRTELEQAMTATEPVDIRLDELYRSVITARQRFEARYGAALPGEDLMTAAECGIVARMLA